MIVEVTQAAPEQEPILRQLLEDYAHELSGMFALQPAPDGRYGYPKLPLYWRDEGRFPFLIHVDGAIAGFALVARGSQTGGDAQAFDMAEFFIVRPYRKRGSGTAAVREIWKRLPAAWEIRVLETNAAALAFWRHAVVSFADAYDESSWVDAKQKRWRVFSFFVRKSA